MNKKQSNQSVKCHLCLKPSKGICDKCREWKEQRIKQNQCPCDVCYEIENYKKAVELFIK